ncbi:MAG: M67 family metallopeptidase [Proteobacteria bacterium]|nr:M67 family metallopeptidase [Pseudomonadota bacterium]
MDRRRALGAYHPRGPGTSRRLRLATHPRLASDARPSDAGPGLRPAQGCEDRADGNSERPPHPSRSRRLGRRDRHRLDRRRPPDRAGQSGAVRFLLPRDLRAQILRESEAAHPRECCGLIEGIRHGEGWRADRLHPAPNLSQDADRFEIDPAVHLETQRGARDRGTAIIGCYHSHPDGRPRPSPRDRAGALEKDFVWLIAGSGGVLAGFVFDGADFHPVPIVEAG